MKRRLVLHLGLWKTGTTTLQSFLRGNPELLAESGVHYPKVGPENPDHPSFRPRPPTAFLAEEVSHAFLGRELAKRRRGPPDDLPLWSTALRHIEESGAHTGIVSYEDFSARPSFYRFEAIADRLKAFDVVGIIYLRPQESWAISLYSHFVRGDRTSLSFREFMESIRHRLTYSTLLDQIQAHIPLDRLIVRNFDEAVKADLIEDFFRNLDLSQACRTSSPDHAARNRSVPHWAALFLLECMRASLPTECLKDVRKALIRSATAARPTQLRPGLDLASPDERAELRAIMSSDAERLAGRCGIRFAEAEPAATPYRPFDKDDSDAIKEMIAPRLADHTRAALDNL